MPARVSPKLHARLEAVPKTVRDIAWKAQVRLCNRYRRLPPPARRRPWLPRRSREMVGFIWAIARHVQEKSATVRSTNKIKVPAAEGGALLGNPRDLL